MHKADKETPGSFLALMVGIFIGAMLVLPVFVYVCRVNWHLRQENQRLRVQVVQQETRRAHLPPHFKPNYFPPAASSRPKITMPTIIMGPVPVTIPVRTIATEEEWNNALHNPAVRSAEEDKKTLVNHR